MKGKTFIIPACYDPILFVGVLREYLSTWDHQSVTKSKSKHTKKLRDKDIEHKYLEFERKYKHLSLEPKCELFKFSFHLLTNGERQVFSEGPPIYLNLTKKPTLHFSDPERYFPRGLLNNPDNFQILTHLKIADLGDEVGWKIPTDEILDFEDYFYVSANVWQKTPIKNGVNKNIKSYNYTQLRLGSCENHHVIHFHYDETEDTLYLIQDVELYFKQLIRCKNFSLGCYFTFRTTQQKNDHEKNCSSEQQIQVSQKELGLNSKLLQKARDHDLIPSKIEPNRSFLFFDIESVLPKSNECFGKSSVKNLHKVVSISVNAHIDGIHDTKVWTVQDSSEEAQIELVRKFVNFCLDALRRVKFDKKMEKALPIVRMMLKNLQNGKKNENFDLEELYTLQTFLSQYLELSVFGYNSSRYDLVIIFDKICAVLDSENFEREKISVLKKGLAYFSLNLGRLHFKDLTCFNCPMSLDRYLKIWNGEEQKLVYPYEKFSSIEEIRDCKIFPPIEDFKTTLKPEIDVQVYEKCKNIFDTRMALPEQHVDKWFSFEDFLKFYNVSDVTPASKALLRQFETYLENFGSYPMPCLGLPSYAKNCMFDLYNPESPNVFTFCDMETTNLFRNQIIGRLTAVYKRHVTLCDEEAAPAAKYNSEGILNYSLVLDPEFHNQSIIFQRVFRYSTIFHDFSIFP